MSDTLRAARVRLRPKFTMDSVQNAIARIGMNANNMMASSTYQPDFITRNRTLVEWMYRSSWLVGKAVDCVPEDMIRKGFTLTGSIDPNEMEEFFVSWDELQVSEKLLETIKWGRLYGGAICVPLIDGQNFEDELKPDTVAQGAFKSLLVLDRWLIQPSFGELVTEFGPNLGKPRFYTILPGAPGVPPGRVHHTRMFRFDGIPMPYNQKLVENFWSISIIERIWDRIVAYDSVSQGIAQLAFRAHLRVLSIEGYRQLVASGGGLYSAVLTQIGLMRQFQSNESISIIDAKDKLEALQYTFAGLPELMIQFGQQISGATGIPLVRLFGQSPAGMNSTGESDTRNYYDVVASDQNRYLKNPTTILVRIAYQSKFGKPAPEDLGIKFNPLWELSDVEKADIAAKDTATVVAATDAGLVRPSTSLKELRQASEVTGRWSNIEEEEINLADSEPPAPERDKAEQDALPKPSLVSGGGPDDGGKDERDIEDEDEREAA